MNLLEIAPGLRYDAAGFWVTPESVETSYPEYGHDFCYSLEDESLWFNHRNRVITATVQRHEAPGALIYDVGAGNGYVASALQRAGFPTVAIEPNRTGAANAVRRGVESVVCGQLPSLAFQHGTADAIGLFDVVEHIETDGRFLESLRPYLKPGGRVYVTVPAYQWLWSSNDVSSGHVRRYTLPRLRQLMERAGYRVDYASYFFACLPLPIFLLRSLPSRIWPKGGLERDRSAAHHGVRAPRVRKLAARALAFESQRMAQGHSIPFGASCLIVGQRP